MATKRDMEIVGALAVWAKLENAFANDPKLREVSCRAREATAAILARDIHATARWSFLCGYWLGECESQDSEKREGKQMEALHRINRTRRCGSADLQQRINTFVAGKKKKRGNRNRPSDTSICKGAAKHFKVTLRHVWDCQREEREEAAKKNQ